MLELKTKQELAKYAFRLASGSNLVRYRNITYIPADYETRMTDVPPDIDRTIWLPLNRDAVRELAAEQFDILFATDGELRSFDFMVAQVATQETKPVSSLLVRTRHGLKELDDQGNLADATGDFRPNTLAPMLNDDQATKDRAFAVVSGWLNSEEEAHSLLRHAATALAPGWSAVKYVLLLGEGRNGKSLFLKMLHTLFGRENVSGVTRQTIAEASPAVTDLNGKLLNIVYDGMAAYVKDSGMEKSLIAGEPVGIRLLYESTMTPVQTNALFLEGLNREPKTGDKTSALQKRLVRFQFPNVYPLDHKFERAMLAEESLGAFMSLLIEHYVGVDDVASGLAPTKRAIELQLEQLFANSLGLQFLKHVEDNDPFGVKGLLTTAMPELVGRFQSWRVKENDMGSWSEPDVMAVFAPLVNTERRSVRVNGSPRKVRVVTSFKEEAAMFIADQKESDDTEDGEDGEAVVDEG